MPKKIDLVGQKFGKLTVTREAGKNKHGGYLWECQCECGKIKVTSSATLRQGRATSCGCGRKKRHRIDKPSTIQRKQGMVFSRCPLPVVHSFRDISHGNQERAINNGYKFQSGIDLPIYDFQLGTDKNADTPAMVTKPDQTKERNLDLPMLSEIDNKKLEEYIKQQSKLFRFITNTVAEDFSELVDVDDKALHSISMSIFAKVNRFIQQDFTWLLVSAYGGAIDGSIAIVHGEPQNFS